LTPTQTNPNSFHGLGIAPKLLEILTQKGFKSPTPIQLQAIPIAIEGKDVMGIAQTGTGKTLGFGVPMLQRIAQNKFKGLILLPTRELAIQVNEALQNLGRNLGLKTAVLIGGEAISRQMFALRNRPHIIIATPGRLIDHIEQKSVHLNEIGILVLDEADRMLDMGFAPQLKQILNHVPKDRQTMLFSATMDPEIVKIASTYMKLPVRVEVAPAGSTASKVSQEIIFVDRHGKMSELIKLLNEYKGSTLVFSRTKHGARKIASELKMQNFTATEIHSNKSLSQRLEALRGFKIGKYRVLVATDIAARGLDVSGIELVINYDLPEQASDYVHRIGRTGRAEKAGHAISFATPDQKRDVWNIERLIKKQLPTKNLASPRSTAPFKNFTAHRPSNRAPFNQTPPPSSAYKKIDSPTHSENHDHLTGSRFNRSRSGFGARKKPNPFSRFGRPRFGRAFKKSFSK
jgi:ATP-dependent RNA helicase RhlE